MYSRCSIHTLFLGRNATNLVAIKDKSNQICNICSGNYLWKYQSHGKPYSLHCYQQDSTYVLSKLWWELKQLAYILSRTYKRLIVICKALLVYQLRHISRNTTYTDLHSQNKLPNMKISEDMLNSGMFHNSSAGCILHATYTLQCSSPVLRTAYLVC